MNDKTLLWIGAIAVGGYLIYTNWSSISASLGLASTATPSTATTVVSSVLADTNFWNTVQTSFASTLAGTPNAANVSNMIAAFQANLSTSSALAPMAGFTAAEYNTVGSLENAISQYFAQAGTSLLQNAKAAATTVTTGSGTTAGVQGLGLIPTHIVLTGGAPRIPIHSIHRGLTAWAL